MPPTLLQEFLNAQYVDVDRHALRPAVTVVSAGSTASVTVTALLRRTQVPAQHYRLSPLFNHSRSYPAASTILQRQLVPTMDKYREPPLLPTRTQSCSDLLTQMSSTPYQAPVSGPTCRPFLRANGKRSRNWRRNRGEWMLRGSSVQPRSSTLLSCTYGQRARSPPLEECQERPFAFTWPYFPLSTSVLSALSLTGPTTRIELYRQALGTWVNVNVGHVIELKESALVFLKAGHVIDYPDFDKLSKPESTPPSPI